MRKKKKSKPTIEELEAILNREEDETIYIKPNGEIQTRKGKKPGKLLTFKENLGGEYALHSLSEPKGE